MDEQPIQVERQAYRCNPQLPPLEDDERMHTLAQAFGDFFDEILLRSHQVLRGKRRQSEFLCVHLQGGTELPERLDVEITQEPFPSFAWRHAALTQSGRLSRRTFFHHPPLRQLRQQLRRRKVLVPVPPFLQHLQKLQLGFLRRQPAVIRSVTVLGVFVRLRHRHYSGIPNSLHIHASSMTAATPTNTQHAIRKKKSPHSSRFSIDCPLPRQHRYSRRVRI